MRSLVKRIELVANLAIIVVAIILGVVLVKTYRRSSAAQTTATAAVRPGTKLGCTPFVRQKVKTLPQPVEKTSCLRLDRC